MALDLGTLTGYLELDSSAFDSTLDLLPDKMGGAGVLMGAAAGAAALGIGMALSQGIQSGFENERLNDALAASLNLTEAQSETAGAAAGALYADAYGESMEDVNGAIESVMSSISGMSDASQADLEAVTASVMDMATAFEIDTGRAAQVAGQLLTNGLATDATHAVDLITASLQRVPAAVREDVLDAASEYGPMFAQLGMSGEEAMGLLASAGEDGAIGIDKMGDALKEFTIRATDGSTASQAAYDAIGLSSDEMSNRLLAGGEEAAGAFDQIVAGLQGIEDPTERANASIALFGTPLEDLGTGAIPDFLDSLGTMGDSLGDVGGAAETMGETLNGNAATSWESMSRTWDQIVGQVGTALVPVLQTVTDWLLANPAAMQIAAVALGVLAIAFLGITAATWAMNTALLANPITWVVLGIVALIAALALLLMNWDTVVAWITEVWGGFMGWLQGVMDGFIGWWNELWAGFGSWVTSVWDGFIAWIVAVWSGFVGWLFGIGAAIAGWWNGLWAGIGAWVQAVWAGFIGWIVAVFMGFMATVMGVGAAISGWWNGLWAGVGALVRAIWAGFIAWVVGVFSGFLATARGIGSAIMGWWSGLWASVGAGVQSAWGGIISWLGGIGGRIQGALSGAGTWLLNIGRNVLNGLMAGLQAGWNTVVGWINGLGGGIIDTFASILGIRSPSRVFRAFGVNITEGLVQGLEAGADAVDARVAGLVDVPTAGQAQADLLARAGTQVYAMPPQAPGMPSTLVVVDQDGQLMATMRVAAREQSDRDGTTATLGRKSPAEVLPL